MCGYNETSSILSTLFFEKKVGVSLRSNFYLILSCTRLKVSRLLSHSWMVSMMNDYAFMLSLTVESNATGNKIEMMDQLFSRLMNSSYATAASDF